LLLLGVYDHCTPELVSLVGQLAVVGNSLQEASQLVAMHGIALDVKTVRRLAYQTAQRVRQQQQVAGMGLAPSATGRRVVVSTDGGRLRQRRPTTTRTATGRAKYDTDWREPKLLIIYVLTPQHILVRQLARIPR
jgi:hypothetical protein